jgi:hypothetical protein
MAWLAAAAVAASVGCTPKPLPEEGSPSALLYTARCGTTCHRPYQPGSLKPKMWETMLARMEIEMARRGMPLSNSERAELLDYLIRNAGTM